MLNVLLPYFIKSNKTDFTDFKEKIAAFEKQQAHIEDSLNQIRTAKSYAKTKKPELTPFQFDPNNLPVHRWKEMGLKDWQIEVIKNYEMKGGKFYQAEDLAKMYSISEEEYKILKPYIRIEKSTQLADKPSINPFPFDPNSITEEDLRRMGIRDNLIKTIKNYRNKGGIFYSKDDFQKLYTITEDEFSQLEPYLFFEKDSLHVKDQLAFMDTLLVDINTADSLDLQQLKGIGPSFSKRIIKYRELLGGYYDINQVLEVYGMDMSRFDAIKKHIYVNEISIQKININNATIKEMIKHPYIEFYIAKSIIAYRNEFGSINKLEEIKNVKLIYDELYQKIVPYLTIN